MVVISDQNNSDGKLSDVKDDNGISDGDTPTGDSEEVQGSLTWRRGCKGKQEEADAVEEEFKPEMSL